MDERHRVLVVGIGNDFRGDDGAGLEVARRIRALNRGGIDIREETADIVGMIDVWPDYELVILADATQSAASPGTVVRYDPASQPIPSVFVAHVSSHGVGVAEAVELAEALDQLPRRLVVWGIEVETFETAIGLSPTISAAVDRVAADIVDEMEAILHTERPLR